MPRSGLSMEISKSAGGRRPDHRSSISPVFLTVSFHFFSLRCQLPDCKILMYGCNLIFPIYLTMTLFHYVASSMSRNGAGRNLAVSAFVPTHRFSSNHLATATVVSSQPSFLLQQQQQQAQQQADAASVLLYNAARRSQATNSSHSSLSRTEIRRMRVADLRQELGRRGLSSSGLREALVSRLLDASSSPTRDVVRKDMPHQYSASSPRQWKRNMSAAPGAFDHETRRTADDQPSDISATTAMASTTTTQLSPDKTYVLRFDGGSRGNPGVAGAGMVLYDADEGQEVWSGYSFMGDKYTNNEAEYTGILEGLRCAYAMGARSVVIQGDSLLVIKQLEGAWRVKAENLRPYHQKALNVLKQFDSFHLCHIEREQNSRADELANEAMDLRTSHLDL